MRLMLLSLSIALSCVSAQANSTLTSPQTLPSSQHPAHASLRAFDSDADFQALLQRWRDAANQQRGLRQRAEASGAALSTAPSAAAPLAAESAAKMADSSASNEAAAGKDSITNVQTAGVDEGGIVKRAGDHLVILRRGRLFTVRVGGDNLQPVAAVDAYAPNANPAGAWYDELLIHGRTVVVVGYSYARGGTEIGLFELGDDGSLAWRTTHHLRSHDYYSSRNYASRLVGNRLVFYAPMRINPWQLDAAQFMPQWRRWQASAPQAPQGTTALPYPPPTVPPPTTPPHTWPQPALKPVPHDWQTILPATRIFRTDDDIDPQGGATLHTVTACELTTRADMHCEASAVLGPPGRVFYVSADNVFVWTTSATRRSPWGRPDESTSAMPRSSVVRLPLDGSAPSALKTTGSPVDALSFLQDSSGHLNVLLRSHARGEGMWQAEGGHGDFALMRVPLTSFGSGRDNVPRSAYRPLQGIQGHAIHNRYVGDWLLVGAHGVAQVHGLRYAEAMRSGETQSTLALTHGVERIEALGGHAVVVGNAGRDLHFTTLRLDGRHAAIASKAVHADAAQGETRTHGFFYRPTGADEGWLGLPIIGAAQHPRAAHQRPHRSSAAVVFLRNRSLDLVPAGKLEARPTTAGNLNDGCKASCVDWYGNARPIFLGDRVFALLGYELVEGRFSGGLFRDDTIDERRRINFAPQPQSRWGREG